MNEWENFQNFMGPIGCGTLWVFNIYGSIYEILWCALISKFASKCDFFFFLFFLFLSLSLYFYLLLLRIFKMSYYSRCTCVGFVSDFHPCPDRDNPNDKKVPL